MTVAADSSSDTTGLPDEFDTNTLIDMASAVVNDVKAIPTEITLVTGVVLALRPVPPLAIRQAIISVPEPKVPMVRIPDREDLEPNPNDPDYLAALAVRELKQFLVTSEVMLLLGTSVCSVPDNAYGPESDEWVEPMREGLGMEVDTSNKHKRYLSWLRFYAIATERDSFRVLDAVTAMSGVTELEVQRAADAFRGSAERGTDPAPTTSADGVNGD